MELFSPRLFIFSFWAPKVSFQLLALSS